MKQVTLRLTAAEAEGIAQALTASLDVAQHTGYAGLLEGQVLALMQLAATGVDDARDGLAFVLARPHVHKLLMRGIEAVPKVSDLESRIKSLRADLKVLEKPRATPRKKPAPKKPATPALPIAGDAGA